MVLPWTPLAGPLGLVPLPGASFAFLAAAVGTYLVTVEVVKRRLMVRLVAPVIPRAGFPRPR